MLTSPSKYLSRPFLRALVENRFISPRGREYSASEVTDLLTEKESKLALQDYAREIEEYHSQPIDSRAEIVRFQEAIFAELHSGILKGKPESTSSDDAQKLITADTIFSLNDLPPQCLIGTAPEIKQRAGLSQESLAKRERKTMKRFQGHEIISVQENYSLAQIRRDIKTHTRILNHVDNASRGTNGQRFSNTRQKATR